MPLVYKKCEKKSPSPPNLKGVPIPILLKYVITTHLRCPKTYQVSIFLKHYHNKNQTLNNVFIQNKMKHSKTNRSKESAIRNNLQQNIFTNTSKNSKNCSYRVEIFISFIHYKFTLMKALRFKDFTTKAIPLFPHIFEDLLNFPYFLKLPNLPSF